MNPPEPLNPPETRNATDIVNSPGTLGLPGTWPRCPEATAYFHALYAQFAARNPLIAELEARFRQVAGVDIRNLIDHWTLPETPGVTEELTALGLTEITLPEGDRVWSHPQARLPKLRFKRKLTAPRLAPLVEDIGHFAAANAIVLESCHGDPDSRYLCAHLPLPEGELMPIERRGTAGYAPGTLTADEAEAIRQVRAKFLARDRSGDELAALARAQSLVEEAITAIGQDRATDEFFAAERVTYLARNRAARWQYEQQQRVGLGWANHDHHTYRSSRIAFRALMRLWHTLGFISRERFYAGADAGWGAQVLEHPVSRVVIFADVDIAPEDLDLDFSVVDLPERATLGTIGLWCALHTGSIASAGMHHLEAEYDFARVQDNLRAAGYGVMAPFTDLPMLKQAFTEPEIWTVDPARVQATLERGAITQAQADRFLTQGAPGSHLEILQRWDGFKGFNKTGISAIIRETDARRAD
jgi:hypothetical protein